MKYLVNLLVAMSAVAGICLVAWQLGAARHPADQPPNQVAPQHPDTRPDEEHRRRRHPRYDFEGCNGCEAGRVVGEKATVGGPVGPGAREVQADLPFSSALRLKNVGGTDGSGLCVFSSLCMAMRFQLERAGYDFRKKMERERGGGYPEKVDAMMAKYCPGIRYAQYEGKDPAILDACLQSGRMACVTYGFGERYGQRIAHMVNLVYLDDQYACVLDNNFIGEDELEWMTRGEFLRRWKLGDPRGYGWAVVILKPAPPPLPWNKVVYSTILPHALDRLVRVSARKEDEPSWLWN